MTKTFGTRYFNTSLFQHSILWLLYIYCWYWGRVAWIAKPKFGHFSWPNPNCKRNSSANLVNNTHTHTHTHTYIDICCYVWHKIVKIWEFLKPSSNRIRRRIELSCLVGERELRCNWDLGFLKVFLCSIVSPYFIMKSFRHRCGGR